MNDKKLRHLCTDLVKGLDLPEPFEINTLVDQLQQRRGRAISLVPMALPPDRGPCGMWVATPDVDYIVYQKHTWRTLQIHIVLHEIGHMLCEHEATPAEHDEVSRLLLPTIDPALVRVVLGRTSYDRDEEKAAELVASLIPLHTSSAVSLPTTQLPPEMVNLVSHLERSLERGSAQRT
ncbi:hypothetical protein [Streptomyces sp. NPDC058739]|uniref:hypothetical protein n=1 Tax=Streptomyces sp. NPDC058739 TaxID=3346618 RepID=UPI00369CC27A